MFWKLGALLIVTVMLIASVIPIRTHAVTVDPATGQFPQRPSLWGLLSHAHLTPGIAVIVLAILGLASFIALKVIRGHW